MEEILNYQRREEDDYYYILGCDQNSSVEQIQTEYKVLALQFHPDKNPDDPTAEAHFQKLQLAKQTLCDPKERSQYDRWRNSGISVSYEQWRAVGANMKTTMHWAVWNNSNRMLTSAGSSSHPRGSPKRDGSGSITSFSRPGGPWVRDTSDMLTKFRNYEI